MAWFKRVPKPIAPAQKTSRIPEGVWVKCPDCGQALYKKDLDGKRKSVLGDYLRTAATVVIREAGW